MSEQNVAHTPTPWRRSQDGLPGLNNIANAIEGADDTLIVYGQVSEADAALIVRAVNSHDELVAALRLIAEYPDVREFVGSLVHDQVLDSESLP